MLHQNVDVCADEGRVGLHAIGFEEGVAGFGVRLGGGLVCKVDF